MNAIEALLTDLKIRLGYKESITLTRDEFNLLVDGDINVKEYLKDALNFETECKKNYYIQVNNLQGEVDDLKARLKIIREAVDNE